MSTLLAADTDGNLVGDQYNSRGGLLSTGKYQVVTTDAVSGTFAAEYRTSSTSGKRYAASCKVGNLTGIHWMFNFASTPLGCLYPRQFRLDGDHSDFGRDHHQRFFCRGHPERDDWDHLHALHDE